MVRSRFAPSPTGFMHIGNLRTALYAYLYAKQNNGKFILRVEDTDLERFVPGALEVIYQTLNDSKIIVDEGPNEGGNYGPYIQTQRKDIYLEYAKKLVESKDAYYCFCTSERLNSLGEIKKYDKHCLHLSQSEIQELLDKKTPYVIRQNMPTEGVSTFTDLVFGEISIPHSELEDQVLIKSDGLPTYNFANVIDDHLMNISIVMRGNEYLSSTPKYNLLYKALGWQTPQYAHLTPVMKNASEKLSKRNGDANFDDFIKKGYLPEAIINYIALLGWSPKGVEEIFSMEELIEKFSISGLSKSSSIFDNEKLSWMNGEYLKKLSLEEFNQKATPFYDQSVIKGRFDYMLFSKILQTRVLTLAELIDKVKFIDEFNQFDPSLYDNKKLKIDKDVAFNVLKSYIPKISEFNYDSLTELVYSTATELNYKAGAVYTVLRIALTSLQVTPGGFVEIALILGKEETIRRLNKSFNFLIN